MDENVEGQERLIAKIQMEYAKGTSEQIASDEADWDIGLLYITSENLWFVNRKKERTQVSFADICDIGDVTKREGGARTDFSEVLNAEYSLVVRFGEDANGAAINISAPQTVLSALKSQLVVRSAVEEKKAASSKDVESKMRLFRKISVFLNMDLPIIADPQMLKYFLGIDNQDFVNILVERAQMGEGGR